MRLNFEFKAQMDKTLSSLIWAFFEQGFGLDGLKSLQNLFHDSMCLIHRSAPKYSQDVNYLSDDGLFPHFPQTPHF